MNIVLDPVTKLIYLEAAWEEEYIETGKKHLKEQVSFHPAYEYYVLHFFQFLVYKTRYEASQKIQRLYMTTLKILTYVSC